MVTYNNKPLYVYVTNGYIYIQWFIINQIYFSKIKYNLYIYTLVVKDFGKDSS